MSILSAGLELEGWPYAPGESPYKAKGTTMAGHVTWATDLFPGGIERADAVVAPEMAEYFRQPFLASAWYDLYPLCHVGPPMAADMGIPYLKLVRDRTRWQAERDIKGVYRILLRAVSAERLARIVPRQIQQSFNFGEVQCRVVHKGHVTGTMRGIPWALLPWLSVVVEEYTTVVIERSGGKSPHVTITRDGPMPLTAAQETNATIDAFFHAE